MNCCNFFLPSSFLRVTPVDPGDMGLPVPLDPPMKGHITASAALNMLARLTLKQMRIRILCNSLVRQRQQQKATVGSSKRQQWAAKSNSGQQQKATVGSSKRQQWAAGPDLRHGAAC